MGKALTALDNFFGIWTQKDSTGVGACDYDQQLRDFPSWKLCLWGFNLRVALSGFFWGLYPKDFTGIGGHDEDHLLQINLYFGAHLWGKH